MQVDTAGTAVPDDAAFMGRVQMFLLGESEVAVAVGLYVGGQVADDFLYGLEDSAFHTPEADICYAPLTVETHGASGQPACNGSVASRIGCGVLD